MVRNAYKTAEPQRPQRTPAGAYYFLQNLLFRAVALTNSGGYIVEAYDADAYGNTLIFIEPGSDGRWFTDDDVQSNYGANEITFCGYRYDPETQNYYVRNRTYNPALGRWIQRDPIGYSGGINLYGYVESLPVGKADPSGFATWNKCCPKAFRLLNELAKIAARAEVSVDITTKQIAEVIGKLELAAGAFSRANLKNSSESLVGLLFGNVATVEVAGAIAAKSIEVKEFTGMITNSRLVRAGARGFKALSPFAKTALEVADTTDIYATVAAWGASEFVNIADIRQTAKIANLLGSSIVTAKAVFRAGEARSKNIDQFIGSLSAIRQAHNGRGFGPGDMPACKQLVQMLSADLPLVRLAAASDRAWTGGLDVLLSRLGASLSGLVHA